MISPKQCRIGKGSKFLSSLICHQPPRACFLMQGQRDGWAPSYAVVQEIPETWESGLWKVWFLSPLVPWEVELQGSSHHRLFLWFSWNLLESQPRKGSAHRALELQILSSLHSGKAVLALPGGTPSMIIITEVPSWPVGVFSCSGQFLHILSPPVLPTSLTSVLLVLQIRKQEQRGHPTSPPEARSASAPSSIATKRPLSIEHQGRGFRTFRGPSATSVPPLALMLSEQDGGLCWRRGVTEASCSRSRGVTPSGHATVLISVIRAQQKRH